MEQLIGEELAKIREQYGDAFGEARFDEATALFKAEVALADDYAEFLTIPGLRADALSPAVAKPGRKAHPGDRGDESEARQCWRR